jgi:thiol:disulfide interchange protein/DsbC/DsbD-like thiol-disulfide interchange protein
MHFSFAPLRIVRWLGLLAACWIAGLAPVHAQFDGPSKQLTPSLIADTTAITAGKPFTAGVRLKMQPGWHVYYQFSGESGAPPRIDWKLPEGFKAGEIQWPVPAGHVDAADMLTYIYENDVLLMVEITPPATLPPGDVTLKAHVDWLVCEEICVPGQADVELKLPAGDAAPANADLFTEWRGRLPKTTPPPFQVKWDRSKANELALRVEGVAKEVKVEFFPLPPKEAKTGQPKTGAVAEDGARTITFPVEGGAPNLPWRGVMTTSKGEGAREGWLIEATAGAEALLSPTPAATAVATTSRGLPLVLVLAFLGGLILNVMPCVLPVIALKIFGFVNQGGQDPGRIFRLGLAFTAGVFTFFLVLATAAAQLKTAFQWGYALQNPYILSGLIVLVFAFSLSLLGVFEVVLGGGTASKLSELSSKEGYGGAFLHGLFTTLLGTSCTAPFLAGSLGYATTQSAPVIYTIFLAAAAGMAMPYFLLTARPAWLKYVPKPGAWMERVKMLMGLIMLGVAVWLFGVMAVGFKAVLTGMTCVLIVVGIACWVVGTWHGSIKAWLAFELLLGSGYFVFLHGALVEAKAGKSANAHAIAWQPYSEDALASARKEGRPVFVDFTAEWCINCKVYEATVLSKKEVGAKFAEKNILPLKADWTTSDPVVTKALQSFQRVGVPLYVLYRPGEDQPVVADAITPGWLIGELDKIKK